MNPLYNLGDRFKYLWIVYRRASVAADQYASPSQIRLKYREISIPESPRLRANITSDYMPSCTKIGPNV